MNKPKVFLYCIAEPPFGFAGYALASSGEVLASHMSTTREWASKDLQTSHNLETYSMYYPKGYEITDLTNTEAHFLEHNDEFMVAWQSTPSPPHPPLRAPGR